MKGEGYNEIRIGSGYNPKLIREPSSESLNEGDESSGLISKFTVNLLFILFLFLFFIFILEKAKNEFFLFH